MNKHSLLLLLSIFAISVNLTGQSLGRIQDNTNPALPNSYNFKEYVYAQPDDQGTCLGNANNTATTTGIFLSQTHRFEIGHPLFFMIGERPALLQIAVTGQGLSPDVTVEGMLNGNSLGVLCLKGPASLSTSIDTDIPNLEDYFTVTLPKAWIKNGLSLTLTVGSDTRVLSSADLEIGPYTEMNLVMVNMDVLDYNEDPHRQPIFDDFLEEMASAIPASVVRFGIFPETLVYPEIVVSNNTEQLARLRSRNDRAKNQIDSDGFINAVSALTLGNLHQSTEDYVSTVYFGNTLNLDPGGWGGGKSFVGPDFTDIFIHELGHALSLPHWGEGPYNNTSNSDFEFLYPYGGQPQSLGGGRGSSWNFIQDSYEFVNTICEDPDDEDFGNVRSDCMQRNSACIETRPSGPGPWDGYGDFSANAIYRYLTGAPVERGEVTELGENRPYRLTAQEGFATARIENGKRTYLRDALQPQQYIREEIRDLPGETKLNQDVYLIYGAIHDTQTQANIVYKPIKYNAHLPPILDPTDPVTLETLRGEQYFDELYSPKDIILKLYYDDGSILHALNPYHSFVRSAVDDNDYGIFRRDYCNFSLVVPGDKNLTKVEVYKRPFCAQWDDLDTPGNINYAPFNITAENFMNEAEYVMEYNYESPKVIGTNSIGNRVWLDSNRNGIQDDDEQGIADVWLYIWADSDGDGEPDGSAFGGISITDENGYYSFTGLDPGVYTVAVWSVNNWEEGEALHGMLTSPVFATDPNNDSNIDNNAINPDGVDPAFRDIYAGTIVISADGEPLNDGDRVDDWFNYDPSGNMTIDFGFYNESTTSTTDMPDIIIDPNAITLYPNPANDQFTISGNGDQYSIEILSATGAIYQNLSGITLPHIVDITTLPSGLFFLKILNEDNLSISMETIVKN